MNNVILIGMPGCGKSTVGVILAKELGYDFLDTDLLICKREHSTLQNIIDTKGVGELLRAEEKVGKSLRASRTVVATGGSMVFSEKAMENLKKDGVCVYIAVPLCEIKKRVTNFASRGIAMKKGETLEGLYKIRTPKYEQFADITVPVNGHESTEDVVKKIAEALGGYFGQL